MTATAALSPTGVIREILSSRSDRALSALEARTWHSWKMALDRSKVLPSTADLAGDPRLHIFVQSGAGARLTDMDGTHFIDLSMNYGAQILGHGHPLIQNAITSQAARGWNLSLPGQDQLALAHLIQAAAPGNERVALCNSGSDATLYAIRAARAFTRKDGIAVFAGSFHGIHDFGSPTEIGDAAVRRRRVGLPEALDQLQTVLPYGHTAAFTHIHKRRHELAAVVVEPVRGARPSLHHATWLRALAAACQKAGVLLILDENLSGFRLAYGGAQELWGLPADLVAYGAIVGGGLPLGAVAGRADVMEMFSHTFAHESIAVDPMFSGNPLSVAAGTAALRHLLDHRATLYPALNEAGRAFAEGFNAFAAGERIPAAMRAAGSIFRIEFGVNPVSGESSATPQSVAETAFYVLALNRGVLMQASRCGFLSTAHHAGDMAAALTVFTDSLRDVREDKLLTAAS